MVPISAIESKNERVGKSAARGGWWVFGSLKEYHEWFARQEREAWEEGRADAGAEKAGRKPE